MNDKFIIPLNGLAAGKNEFQWQAGKEFFEAFDNAEVLDAEIVATAFVEKSGGWFGVDCELEGRLFVTCDRCLGELEMPLDTEILLSIKFGNEESSDEHQEGEREIIFVPQGEAEYDLSQVIYDYICLSLPLQRYHAEGECNPEVVKYLYEGEPLDEKVEEANNPFAALKDLIK